MTIQSALPVTTRLQRGAKTMHRLGWGILCFALVGLLLAACAPQRQLVLHVDGEELHIRSAARTIGELLSEQNIELGKLDRVEPDVWEETDSTVPITVVRVSEETVAERVEVPFQRRTVRNRALPENERRLIQPGQNGEEEILYRITSEDGEQVLRKEIRRQLVRPAIDEIVMVGGGGQLATIPITGTLSYVSSGNAWIMRDSTAGRRALTSSGDLDQRVFALSPDGARLLYSRGVAAGPPTPLNSLWVITTTVVGEEPTPLGIEGAIYAEWLPDNDSFVYSTADRISGSPGWKARSDLHVFALETMTDTHAYTELSDDLYNWWGSRFAVSPDGRYVAYGAAAEIGLIRLSSGRRETLYRFPVYHTYSEWVWIPSLSWSPDGNYLVATVHGEGLSPLPEDSPLFDVHVLSVTGGLNVRLVPQAGMWAMPVWSPETEAGSAIVYGQARTATDSQNSLYDLYVMDRDGSNDRMLFPDRSNGLRLPGVTWSPQADQLVFTKDGDLYLFDLRSERVHALTDDGYSGMPQWAD